MNRMRRLEREVNQIEDNLENLENLDNLENKSRHFLLKNKFIAFILLALLFFSISYLISGAELFLVENVFQGEMSAGNHFFIGLLFAIFFFTILCYNNVYATLL